MSYSQQYEDEYKDELCIWGWRWMYIDEYEDEYKEEWWIWGWKWMNFDEYEDESKDELWIWGWILRWMVNTRMTMNVYW